MLTLSFQTAAVTLSLLFAIIALGVANRLPSEPATRRATWILTGIAFGVGASSAIVQNAWALIAFNAGPKSDLWSSFVRWAPAFNGGRGGLKVAYALTLAAIPYLEFLKAKHSRIAIATMLVGMLIGGVGTSIHGRGGQGAHLLSLAVSNASLLVILGGALLIHLAKDGMDRLLWSCLCLFGFRLSLNTAWISALAPAGPSSAWVPPVWGFFAVNMAVYIAMCALAWQALRHARNGVCVPAVFERLKAPKVRTFG